MTDGIRGGKVRGDCYFRSAHYSVLPIMQKYFVNGVMIGAIKGE